MQSIIIKPIVTEKANDLQEKQNTFGFIVDKRANKIQIKKTIENMYGVTVDSVRTMVTAGKSKTRYTKSSIISGRQSGVKKAFVKLAEGEFLDIYENL